MFPSGMALDGTWDLPSIERAYKDITVLKNEDGIDELGFQTLEIAEDYCRRFCMIGHILQLNENKLTLHLLGQIMNMAVEQGVLKEEDFMNKSEREIMDKLEQIAALREPQEPQKLTGIPELVEGPYQNQLARLYKTFRTMTKIEHTDSALPAQNYFCISLNVKQRYIDPLVNVESQGSKNGEGSLRLSKGPATIRLSQISPFAKKIIEDFKTYSDTKYGCVKLVD